MAALFKTPKAPKPQPAVTPQDAFLSAQDEAQRIRKRVGRAGNMLSFLGRRPGTQAGVSTTGGASALLGGSGVTGSSSGSGGAGGGSGGGGWGGGNSNVYNQA